MSDFIFPMDWGVGGGKEGEGERRGELLMSSNLHELYLIWFEWGGG